MITIQEALRELNKRPLRESSKRDDIDAAADDKKEEAKANLEKVIDDADSDKDYKLKEDYDDIDTEDEDDWYFEVQQPKEQEALNRLSDEIGFEIDIESDGNFGEYFCILVDGEYLDDDAYHKASLINNKSADQIYNVIKRIVKKYRPDLIDDTDKLKEGVNSIVKKEDLKEDLSTFNTLPAELLSVSEIKDFIRNIPEADPHRPPVFFKLGYMKELGPEIAAKYRGGRGAGDNSNVRIIKCTEYPKLYTGIAWDATDATKKADAILGKERHTGERTGFSFQGEDNMANRIGSYANGKEALQAYIADNSRPRVKYYISIDEGELQEAAKNEIAQYLTSAAASRLETGIQRKAAGVDAEGNEIFDKPINRFPLTGIYMIGNLGHSVF